MDMTKYESYRRGCGERPGLVIVEYRKDSGYFGYETMSSQAWFHGIKGDATPFKDRIVWVGRNYIELPVNDEGEIRKQLDLLDSLNPKKPLMQKSGFMSKKEFVKAVDKVSKGLESKLI